MFVYYVGNTPCNKKKKYRILSHISSFEGRKQQLFMQMSTKCRLLKLLISYRGKKEI